MEAVRFAVCSDIHYDLIPDAAERLESFIAFAQQNKPDFIIHLGDFCYANEKNSSFVHKWHSASQPRYHVLGNHDMDHNTKAQATAFLGMPAPYYSFDAGWLHCVVLDPNHLRMNWGLEDYSLGNYFLHADKINWLGNKQLEWLRADLAATSRKTVIFSHQSLADPTFGARDVEKLHSIFREAKGKVIACFNGHDHTDGVRVTDGVYYVSINSASFFYMSSNICIPRYSQEITERYPILREAAPYKDPLYSLVSVTPEGISITGCESSFVGPDPVASGHCGHAGGHPASPCIRPRYLSICDSSEYFC